MYRCNQKEIQLLFYPGSLKYNDKWCIHEFKTVIWIYNMANIYITKHARLKSINKKKQFYSYMMAKKMYLRASSKKLQVHAKYVFHATVHVFTENYCSWLCMCDLEAEGKIDMFMLGQKIILLFLFLPLTILFL